MAEKVAQERRSRVPFLAPTFVQQEIGKDADGRAVVLKFYPVSLSMAFKLKVIAKPLAAALTALMAQTNRDQTVSVMKSEQSGDHVRPENQVITAITPELARLRIETQTKAIGDLIEALTDRQNGHVIAELICDSLREDYPQGAATRDDFEDLCRLDAPTFANYLKGVAAANKSIFGPLGDRVFAAGDRLANAFAGRSATTPERSATTESSDQPAPRYEKTQSPS